MDEPLASKGIINEILAQIPNEAQQASMKNFLQNLLDRLPQATWSFVKERDGAAQFARELPKTFPPETVFELKEGKSPNMEAWEIVGRYYMIQGRYHEALLIFFSLYDHMLNGQLARNSRSHKGVPLVWIHECYKSLGYPVLAKRYLMLTLCEDAITCEGIIEPNTSGVYFRLVWKEGLSDDELSRYATSIYHLSKEHPNEVLFPEWTLQRLDQDWMIEVPSPQEATVYSANRIYIKHLFSQIGDKTGRTMEELAAYLLSCMPGCRTTIRDESMSTDYDIVCSMEGFEVDFRSEFGRYFFCECKDWGKPADITAFAKFCRILDSTKSRFGIIFSREGITGQGTSKDAAREQLKVFQDRGMVIIVVDKNDLGYVANGGNFTNLLRKKYKAVRLDLKDKK